MNFNQVIEILCKASIEPIFICSQVEFVDCNQQFSEAIGLSSKHSLSQVSLDYILETYFLPNYLNNNGIKVKARIDQLGFMKTTFNGKHMHVPLKVVKWEFLNNIYYTISTREVSKTIYTSYLDYSGVDDPSNCINEDFVKVRSFEELKQIADAMPCLVFCTDTLGQQLFVNEVYRKTLNIDINGTWAKCLKEDEADVSIKNFHYCLTNGLKYEKECMLRPIPKDENEDRDNYRWYIVRVVPVFIKGTKTVDIHDMKMALEEKQILKVSEQAAKEKSRIKSEFLAIMSHELRTPLTLIQDILDYSRIESGKLSIVRDYFDLKKLLDNVKSITKICAEKKGLEFKIETIGDNEFEFYGDFNRIMQIFNNLISNAIKFTQEGSITIIAECLKTKVDGAILKVRIEDTGCGLSSDCLESLFKAWSQSNNGAKKNMSSGLGLYISKSLVKMMNGEIGIDNIYSGTRAWFNIPFKIKKVDVPHKDTGNIDSAFTSKKDQILSECPKEAKIVKVINSNVIKNTKILMAEDNLINQKIMLSFLKKMKIFDCDLAQNGQEALDMYFKKPRGYYSVILMDQSMPRYNGDYVSEKIKEDNKDQKIIFISANVFIKDNHTKNKLVGLIDDYISKPFTFNTFFETISKWIL